MPKRRYEPKSVTKQDKEKLVNEYTDKLAKWAVEASEFKGLIKIFIYQGLDINIIKENSRGVCWALTINWGKALINRAIEKFESHLGDSIDMFRKIKDFDSAVIPYKYLEEQDEYAELYKKCYEFAKKVNFEMINVDYEIGELQKSGNNPTKLAQLKGKKTKLQELYLKNLNIIYDNLLSESPTEFYFRKDGATTFKELCKHAFEQMERKTKSSSLTCFLFTLRFRNGGGHVVGFHFNKSESGALAEFFDANIGLISFKAKRQMTVFNNLKSFFYKYVIPFYQGMDINLISLAQLQLLTLPRSIAHLAK